MKMRNSLIALALAATLPLLGACSNDPEWALSEEETNLLIVYLTGDKQSVDGRGGYFARLWYLQPGINSNPEDTDYITLATSNHVTNGRDKLIMIMGWQATDEDEGDLPSENALKKRMFGTWSTFFGSTEYATKNTTFDMYAFTYLSSNQVSQNGARFRNRMDNLFGAETGKVNILAHSMGGLVSRYAVYEGNDAPYLNKVVTLGTPFHGSPWASPQFQSSNILGSLATFFTSTSGGSALAYDNVNGDLAGASNAELAYLNSLTARDSKFVAYYYGNVTNSSPSFAVSSIDSVLSTACNALGSTGGSTSDCIVPAISASRNSHGNSVAAGNYGHSGIAMGDSTLRTAALAQFP